MQSEVLSRAVSEQSLRELKESIYECEFQNNLDYDFSRVFIDAINEYIKIHGYGHNQSCGWSNEKLFSMLDEAGLYDKTTFIIPNNKFYWVCNDKREYENLNKAGWASNVAYALPTQEALKILTTYLKGKRALSIGSQLALWEHMLENNGCNIICTDIQMWPFTYKNVIEIDINIHDVFKQLTAKGIIRSTMDIDVLFLGWPEPDKGCQCCETKYCKMGYDWDTLRRFKGSTVVLIYDDDYEDNGNFMVCSSKCRTLLAKKYQLREKIQLPFNDSNEYHPRLEIYILDK
eukprot:Pompholyxophrys_sp_v1_NODE_3_length_18401_cov_4.332280.p6 type:complete len:289 gc:universal NODE_3_length_18401_cov_4.332280:11110-10244(-)